jgi:RNA polymerase sigma-70 factor (ECF subfamily)
VRAGCVIATAELFRRHHGPLLRYAKTLTSDSAEAEDLVSEAIERTLERVRTGTVPLRIGAYLATAVRNGSVDEFRRTNRLSRLDMCDPDSGGLAPGSGPLDFTTGLVDRDQLRRAFSALSPRYRLVLWLTAVEGRDLAYVGTELGINANAAAALAHRARAALRHGYRPDRLSPSAPARSASA